MSVEENGIQRKLDAFVAGAKKVCGGRTVNYFKPIFAAALRVVKGDGQAQFRLTDGEWKYYRRSLKILRDNLGHFSYPIFVVGIYCILFPKILPKFVCDEIIIPSLKGYGALSSLKFEFDKPWTAADNKAFSKKNN